ncbi:MAG: hypothetical protein WAW61_16865 [Methylococcaceae bacterium]
MITKPMARKRLMGRDNRVYADGNNIHQSRFQEKSVFMGTAR